MPHFTRTLPTFSITAGFFGLTWVSQFRLGFPPLWDGCLMPVDTCRNILPAHSSLFKELFALVQDFPALFISLEARNSRTVKSYQMFSRTLMSYFLLVNSAVYREFHSTHVICCCYVLDIFRSFCQNFENQNSEMCCYKSLTSV